MALLPAKCPECGGFVEVDNEKELGICQHCGQPFVVEKAIQTFNNYYNITYVINQNTTHNYSDGTVVNIYEDKSKDFVIEGGVLKKYQGESVDVVIPDGVIEIGEQCFKGLKIKSVRMPDSVTSISREAFYECTNLTSINIPDSVTNIGRSAFSGCTSLTSITIPDKVSKIDWCTFSRCGISAINIPDSITSIGERAFVGCTSLISLKIGINVTNIDEDAFSGCTKLEKVYWNAKNVKDFFESDECSTTVFKNAGTEGAGIEILFGKTVEHIPSNLFYTYRNLYRANIKDVIIGENVKSIGDAAFCWCSNLTSITIPKGVKSIGVSAFSNCTSLASVNILNSETSIGPAAFNDYWARKGLCSFCGGEFKGLVIKKCSKCGREK